MLIAILILLICYGVTAGVVVHGRFRVVDMAVAPTAADGDGGGGGGRGGRCVSIGPIGSGADVEN